MSFKHSERVKGNKRPTDGYLFDMTTTYRVTLSDVLLLLDVSYHLQTFLSLNPSQSIGKVDLFLGLLSFDRRSHHPAVLKAYDRGVISLCR